MNNVETMTFIVANLPKKGNKIQHSFRLDKKRAYEIVTWQAEGGNQMMNHFHVLRCIFPTTVVNGGDPVASGFVSPMKDWLVYKSELNMNLMTMVENGLPG